MLSIEQLKEIAHEVLEAQAEDRTPIFIWTRYDKASVHRFAGTVVAKQRPRISKGRAFTPAETRNCEAAIRKWAQSEGITPVTFPIRVQIEVIESVGKAPADDILHSIYGLTYNVKGDVDNFGKTILDALNGIAYKDDKQIAQLGIKRRYGRNPGFIIRIQRCGLSKSEYINFKKVLTWQT